MSLRAARLNRTKESAATTSAASKAKQSSSVNAAVSWDELPDNATPLRRELILQMQRYQGNAAVVRTLNRSQAAHSSRLVANSPTENQRLAADRGTSVPIVQRAGAADMLMAGAAKQLLKQAAAMVGVIPDKSLGPLTFLAKAGLVGFLKRLVKVPASSLVKMAKKVFQALQSPSYLVGYLLGLLKGFFVDGLAGIFTLIYDLGKLAIKLQTFGLKVATTIGSGAVRALTADIKGIGDWILKNAPGLASTLLKELGGKGGLMGTVAQVAGYLLNKVKGAATSVGGKIADGLISFFGKSKEEIGKKLGEVAGRISGAALFEIILAVFTSGGGAALTAAKTGARTILGLLAKMGRGFRAVLGPLGEWISRAMKALKGWALAFAKSSGLKSLGTKLQALFQKLTLFTKSVLGRLKSKKGTGPASNTRGGSGRSPTGGGPAAQGPRTPSTTQPPLSTTQPPLSTTQPPLSTTRPPPGHSSTSPAGHQPGGSQWLPGSRTSPPTGTGTSPISRAQFDDLLNYTGREPQWAGWGYSETHSLSRYEFQWRRLTGGRIGPPPPHGFFDATTKKIYLFNPTGKMGTPPPGFRG